jgi:hypothetical protein
MKRKQRVGLCLAAGLDEAHGLRVIIVFEGCNAAGAGGSADGEWRPTGRPSKIKPEGGTFWDGTSEISR